MTIKAVFTGKDSMGYENGYPYVLKVSNNRGMDISRVDGTGKCSYQSLSSFLKNWSSIKVEKVN